MNREDIIRMAREANNIAPRDDFNQTAWVFGDDALQRFAALVAAAERDALVRRIDEAIRCANAFRGLFRDIRAHLVGGGE